MSWLAKAEARANAATERADATTRGIWDVPALAADVLAFRPMAVEAMAAVWHSVAPSSATAWADLPEDIKAALRTHCADMAQAPHGVLGPADKAALAVARELGLCPKKERGDENNGD